MDKTNSQLLKSFKICKYFDNFWQIPRFITLFCKINENDSVNDYNNNNDNVNYINKNNKRV